ncbi:Protein of unknown function [Gryllus bimaculatus]|nr:Protein of unknown function [Gryllus bimaculatus]
MSYTSASYSKGVDGGRCLGAGTRRLQLRLELLSASLPLLAPEEQALLGSRVVRIVYECPAELPPPQPRVAAGLSPIINRQVGVVGDGVPFCSDVPKPAMAMLGAYALARRNYKWGPLQPAKARTTSDSEESESVCDSKCKQCPQPSACAVSKPKENESDDDDFPGEADREGQGVERLLVPVLPSDTPGVFIEPASPEADAGREGFTEGVEEAVQYEDYEVGDKASSPIEGEPVDERENNEQYEPLSAPEAAVPESADAELAVPAEPMSSPASYPLEKETSQAGSTSSGKKVRLSVPLVTVVSEFHYSDNLKSVYRFKCDAGTKHSIQPKPTTLPVEFSEKARKGSEETQKQDQANATGCPAAVAHAPGRPTLGGRVTPGWLGYRPANKDSSARGTLHVGKLASDAVQNRTYSSSANTSGRLRVFHSAALSPCPYAVQLNGVPLEQQDANRGEAEAISDPYVTPEDIGDHLRVARVGASYVVLHDDRRHNY